MARDGISSKSRRANVAILAAITGIFLGLASAQLARAEGEANILGIPEYHQVNKDISRGGRPEAAGLKLLASRNIKTILDLENDQAVVSKEIAAAKALGMRVYSSPMDWDTRPTDEQVSGIFQILEDPSKFPIFVHCKHGQDRTGLIIGLYRVLHEGWKPKAAYDEMLATGFHPKFDKLVQYFRDKTGFSE